MIKPDYNGGVKKTIKGIAIRSLMFLGIFLAVYGLWSGLRFEYHRELGRFGAELSELRWNLVQNRLAFVGLTKFDPTSPSAIGEKEVLLKNVEESIKAGLEKTDNIRTRRMIDPILTRKWSELIRMHREIYSGQRGILENLYKQQTFTDGMKVLQSEESVKLLTDQTNLILEYEFWEDRVREKLSPTH